MAFRNPGIVTAVLFFILLTQQSAAQQANKASQPSGKKFGVKAGLNFYYMDDLKSFKVSNNTGFMAGAWFAPPSTSRVGFRSELVFSRQGYEYESSRQTGSVMLDYILLPQLTTIRVTRFLEINAGAQLAFLLNSKVDSSGNPSSVPNFEKAKNYFSKLNYGVAAGVEIKPFAGLLAGARYNLFFNLTQDATPGSMPPYLPPTNKNLKNGLIQVYAGYVF